MCLFTDYRTLSSNMMANMASSNLTGHPSLSINAGFIDGLPVGMQLTGKHFDEVTLLKVAKMFEGIRE